MNSLTSNKGQSINLKAKIYNRIFIFLKFNYCNYLCPTEADTSGSRRGTRG